MEGIITEYCISYNDKGEFEFITQNKDRADEVFRKTNKDMINQYYRKNWVLVNGEYEEEECVKIYYNGI